MKRAAAALLLILAVTALAVAATASGDDGPAEATIAIHFSRFSPEAITLPAGESVTITLQNDDPIEHEWIVGTAEVHERHRNGTEPFHDQIPTEITIPALSTRETILTFDRPGDYAFICHLPGHEAYGMTGTITVVEN